ncbi:MAG: hypothetical protein K8T89_22010 [Planctomycetes bacterium]|nr:hypothetical protein [Planctomycetota bacterium]
MGSIESLPRPNEFYRKRFIVEGIIVNAFRVGPVPDHPDWQVNLLDDR